MIDAGLLGIKLIQYKINYKMNLKEYIFAPATYQHNDTNNENNYKLFPCPNFSVQLVTLQFPSAGVFYFTHFKTATK